MSDWSQPLHCDMGALPDAGGNWVCNTIWLLDDFTPENGPTRCVPGTHKSGKLPQEAMADPAAPHPDEVKVGVTPLEQAKVAVAEPVDDAHRTPS